GGVPDRPQPPAAAPRPPGLAGPPRPGHGAPATARPPPAPPPPGPPRLPAPRRLTAARRLPAGCPPPDRLPGARGNPTAWSWAPSGRVAEPQGGCARLSTARRNANLAGSDQDEPLQPGGEEGPVAEDLDALGVRGQAAVGDPEDVGDGAADRDRGLVVGVAPGEAGGGQLDEPLGRHLGAGVGGVEGDGPLGTGVAGGGARPPRPGG